MTTNLSLKDRLTTEDGITIFDVAWTFKDDHPSTEYETGQQKGGSYVCRACNINPDCHKIYNYTFKCKDLSVKDRIEKVVHTFSSQN